MTLLVMSNVVSAQQSRSDEKLEFRPNWGLKVQGGASFTIGEADFSKLLSPAAQLSATYNFHHAMGVRFGFSGWEGKGTVVVTDEMYSFRFLQLNADYVLDLASLFGGFKHDRIWTPYVFAGIGGAYGFDNKEAGKYVAEFGDVVSRYWETAPFFVVRAGLGVDFWVAKNVALGLEANANGEDYARPKSTAFLFIALGIALVISFIIAIIWVSVLKSKLTSVAFEGDANRYRVADSFRIMASDDRFLYKTLNRIPQPKPSSSGGGSRGGSSGGGSRGGKF